MCTSSFLIHSESTSPRVTGSSDKLSSISRRRSADSAKSGRQSAGSQKSVRFDESAGESGESEKVSGESGKGIPEEALAEEFGKPGEPGVSKSRSRESDRSRKSADGSDKLEETGEALSPKQSKEGPQVSQSQLSLYLDALPKGSTTASYQSHNVVNTYKEIYLYGVGILSMSLKSKATA